MMKWTILAISALLLIGCFGPQKRAVEVAYHQLTVAPQTAAGGSNAISIDLRKVEVRAASWLASTDMQYRFVNTEPTRRRVYADSRWVAAPGEMIEQAMNRQLLKAAAQASSECRLRVDLDEFIQEFDSPQSSRVVIEARLSLLGPRGDVSLAQHPLSRGQATSSANATGGVVGLSALTGELVNETSNWLGRLKIDAPAVLAQCR